MSRMDLNEALVVARSWEQAGKVMPATARLKLIKRLERALTWPWLRRQHRVNAAVVDALEGLRLGLDQAGTSPHTSGRAEFIAHHEGIAALRRDMVILQQELRVAERRVDAAVSEQRQALGQLDLFLNTVRRSLPEAPAAAELAAPPVVWDRLYNSFEDQKRGTFDEIQQRLAVYLPDLPRSGTGPVVDIGCGRGEWLELLRDKGIPAYGVDSNPEVVERATARGLEVRTEDGLEHLRTVAERSLSAVTAFHVAEHLPLEPLIELIDLSVRALRPGGRLILETPNPGNLTVGANSFWLDPTHVKPLPSGLLAFLVTGRGFVDVEVRMLDRDGLPVPTAESAATTDQTVQALVRVVNQHLGAATDYAVLGTRL